MTTFFSRAPRWFVRITIGAALALSTATSALALEGDALAQTCEIRAALVAGDGVQPTDVIGDYFAWNTTIPRSRIKAGLAALETLEFTQAQVFEGISAGTYYQTAIIAAGLPKNSPLFIELRFELIGDAVRLTNVNFKDNWKKLFPEAAANLKLAAVTC